MENFLTHLTKYNPHIERIFSKSLKHTLNKLYEISLQRDEKIFLVGGVVRDIFLGRNSNDVDLVLQGNSQEFALSILPNFKVSKHRYTERFLTYNIFTHIGTNIDIASFREEIYEKPGALPVVSPSTLEKDCVRRDFTINAMYISFDEEAKLYDKLNGLEDLKNKIIRVIHEKSFEDDPTRIFRAIKFAGRYNFTFDEKTKVLLKEAMEKSYLSSISKMRIKNEFYMLLAEKNLSNILTLFREYGIFKFLNIPEPTDEDIEKIIKITTSFLFRKVKAENKISKGNFILLYLMRNLSYEEKIEHLQFFEFSEKNINSIMFTDEERKKIMSKLSQADKKSKIHKILRYLTPFKLLYLYFTAEENRKKLKSYIFELNSKNAIISGSDLISMGFKDDVSLGEYLEQCLSIQLDMENPTKEKIIEQFIKELNLNE